MPRAFDTRPSEVYLRLTEARASPADGPAVNASIEELVRVLSASRPGGVFLCPGHGAGETRICVLDGMDLASRLVVVIDDGDEAQAIRTKHRGGRHAREAVTPLFSPRLRRASD